jgi:hypothetical protein
LGSSFMKEEIPILLSLKAFAKWQRLIDMEQ